MILTIDHPPFFPIYKTKDNNSDFSNFNLRIFKTINSLIYETLNNETVLPECIWCNPQKDKPNAKKMCDNCKNLKEEFEEFC